MKITRFLSLLLLVIGPSASADELIKNVQTELKDQGFYYSEITGENGPDTTAAIKRFQIRNGMEVTGTLTAETLKALGLAQSPPTLEVPEPKPAEPAPRVVPPPPIPSATRPPSSGQTRPPVNLRRDETVQESDRNFLDRQNTAPRDAPDRNAQGPDQPPGGGPMFGEIYQHTPYANAPLVVQQDVLRKAQRLLAEQGFYHSEIDGLPGPATQAGILGFQRMVRLPMSGRLDVQTLDVMRLLPGRGNGPPMQPFTRHSQRPPKQKVYRGIWID